jgi:hypothetical protein
VFNYGNCNFQGAIDECVFAADIYQCGRDKAPNVTEAMQANLISDAMAAAPVSLDLFFCVCIFN